MQIGRIGKNVVAALCVYFAIGSVVMAVPNPRIALDRAAWHDPRAKREIRLWAKRLGVPPKTLRRDAYAFIESAAGVLHVVRAPFELPFAVLGIHQSWAMFAGGSPTSDDLEVHARAAGGAWRPVYVRDDPSARFMAGTLDDARMRAVTFEASWKSRVSARKRLCRAIAKRVLRAEPLVDEVRCSFVKTPLRAPPTVAANPTRAAKEPERSREVIVPRKRA